MAPISHQQISSYIRMVNRARLQRYQNQRTILLTVINRHNKLLQIYQCLLSILLHLRGRRYSNQNGPRVRRLQRNGGWFELAWQNFTDERFKKTFRVSRETFNYILERIHDSLRKETIAEDPISPECRLAVCLYRLGRGDYLYTISELAGIGESTACEIVMNVSKAIIDSHWEDSVAKHLPTSHAEMENAMILMDHEWQFPFAFAAIDGSHIPIKCPPGGAEAAKEYHNFKNFFSVVLMAFVDAKYRFVWGSCGYPGNSHDSIIFQSTNVYDDLNSGNFPAISHKEGNTEIPPILLGDGAFPFHSWLMKPYSQATLSAEQSYFNYRLSRARMVTEGAFGKLKGRWRILSKTCESNVETVKAMTLACVVLHNVCIEQGDVNLRKWDLHLDEKGNERRPSAVVRDMLHMTGCNRVRDSNKRASTIRDALKCKFFKEKQKDN